MHINHSACDFNLIITSLITPYYIIIICNTINSLGCTVQCLSIFLASKITKWWNLLLTNVFIWKFILSSWAVQHGKRLVSPDCQGRPRVQASCWYLYGYAGCSHCCLSPPLHPPHCWVKEWRKWKFARDCSHLQIWHPKSKLFPHPHQPVAEVVFIVSSDQRHGELVSPICIKHIELLRSWRGHFIRAWTWRQGAWRHTVSQSVRERLLKLIYLIFYYYLLFQSIKLFPAPFTIDCAVCRRTLFDHCL